MTTTTENIAVEEKLVALCQLQIIDSEIDHIKTLRGELPLEVQDLEDDVEGLKTRIDKCKEDGEKDERDISNYENQIKDAKAQIKKYEKQQTNVRNNREFDSLSKEIEFQGLEIQLAEKKIKEIKVVVEGKDELIKEVKRKLKDKKSDLKLKSEELENIIAETEKDEKKLQRKRNSAIKIIEERLLNYYDKIRANTKNGLAVVAVEREACGGCFNEIPPQRQVEIRSRKKIIVCEHCGRILVDLELKESVVNKFSF